MKKLPFFLTAACAVLLLAACIFIGCSYLDLDSRFQSLDDRCQSLEAEASRLKTDNSSLTAELENNSSQMEKQEDYIQGQKEQISELSEQLETFTEAQNSSEDTGGYEAVYEKEDDPFPSLYAVKEDEDAQQDPQKIVYLTFDDGPSELTPKVLDLLDEYHARATFFVVCKNNEAYASYLSDIVERGHTLALHSYSHDYGLIYQSVDSFLADYEKVYDWVYEETGYSPCLFRFPGGSNNGSSSIVGPIIAEMERRGFSYFDWNVSSGDGSMLTTTDNIIDNVCSTVGYADPPVVLMHDGHGKNATLAALPSVLEYLSGEGFEFRSLDPTVTPVRFR